MTVAAAAPPRPAAVPDEDPFRRLGADAVIAVAMSGGVDSSVAAALCQRSGRRTVGVTLAMWPRDRERDRDRGCCSVDAVEDARRVAAAIGIPHYSWNLEPQFTAEVIADFEEEYAAGRTPNPCVRCNERIKFGAMLDMARRAGATHLATGHWARTGRRGDAVTLHRGANRAKDQAYTLHRLTGVQLASAVFPLGPVSDKQAVRALAAELGLGTAAKPDSQELCFVEISVVDELERRLGERCRPGPIVDITGARVGEHRGIAFYTVGQRSRLGLATNGPDDEPRYVVEIDAAANTVVVGPRRALERQQVRLRRCTWTGTAPWVGEALEVQLRAHGQPSPMTVSAISGDALQLRCDPPATQVAPGQAAVVYAGHEVLGGGVIA